VDVRVRRDRGSVFVEISDDGVGGADERLGSGLRGLADRLEALDGSLHVVSPARGGTVVTAAVPCA
jgi:signal transduction histidine kinase